MSPATTLLLGFIAGVTILLGLPVGRIRRTAAGLRVVLNAVAVGVLVFLVWDVFSAAWEPIDAAVADAGAGKGGLGVAIGYGVLFVLGLAAGLLGLVAYDRWTARRRPGGAVTAGSGADDGDEVRAARRTALMIAVGIGLHNFAEGLAIGQSAASGEIGLAVLLVIGFALHNATEGFGIVAPMAGVTGTDGRPVVVPWRYLLLLGLIGGGPTFVGTAVGRAVTSEPVSVVFLTLAAGSILYVIVQLLGLAGRHGRRDLVAGGLLMGLIAGFLTDAVVTAGGV